MSPTITQKPTSQALRKETRTKGAAFTFSVSKALKASNSHKRHFSRKWANKLYKQSKQQRGIPARRLWTSPFSKVKGAAHRARMAKKYFRRLAILCKLIKTTGALAKKILKANFTQGRGVLKAFRLLQDVHRPAR